MEELKISYRINELIKCVKGVNTVADIGCDHGYIPYVLLKTKVCKKAVLIDVSIKSLNKAKKLFAKNGLSDFADFRNGSGLSVLKEDEADFAVIAGMGGAEIINILKDDNKGIKRFLLQPMRNVLELREFLIKNGFEIEKDFIIFDKKSFYDIITVSKGRDVLNELELNFGKDNLNNKSAAFIKFLNYKKNQSEKLLDGLNNEKRKEELKHYLSLIDRVKEYT